MKWSQCGSAVKKIRGAIGFLYPVQHSLLIGVTFYRQPATFKGLSELSQMHWWLTSWLGTLGPEAVPFVARAMETPREEGPPLSQPQVALETPVTPGLHRLS